jgi:hypothetical protein
MKLAGFLWTLAVLGILFGVLSWSSPESHAQNEQTQSTPSNENANGEHSVTKERSSGSAGWRKYKEKIEHNEKFITSVSTIFIAAFTVLLAFATFFLWSATRDLVEDAKHSGEENSRNMQAAIAESGRSADAAKEAADAARDSIKLAGDTAKKQLRAYVSPTGGALANFGSSQSFIEGLVLLKNSGQTPAYDFESTGVLIDSVFPLTEPLPEEGTTTGKTILGPGTQFAVRLKNDKLIPQVALAPFRQGTRAIYMYGKFSYRDAFGDAHSGQFRLFYGGKTGTPTSGEMSFYETGNDAD